MDGAADGEMDWRSGGSGGDGCGRRRNLAVFYSRVYFGASRVIKANGLLGTNGLKCLK